MTPRSDPDMTVPATGPRRKKSLGQHFLNSQKVINRIIQAAGVDKETTVLEIGPGRGALTRHIYGGCGRMVLIEMDSELIPVLGRHFPVATIVEADAASIGFDDLFQPAERVVVVGNLPYNAGGRILFNLLVSDFRFDRMVLMFQKEVARRFCACPGDRDYGAVSMLTSLLSDTRYLFDVGPDKFVPPPRVMSGVVMFQPKEPVAGREFLTQPVFAGFVHGIFAQPRKTVTNSMMNGLGISRDRALELLGTAGVDPGVRPCMVTPQNAVDMFLTRFENDSKS